MDNALRIQGLFHYLHAMLAIFEDSQLHIPIYALAALFINVYDPIIVGFVYGMVISHIYEHADFQRCRLKFWGHAASGALLALPAGISILQPQQNTTSKPNWLSFVASLIVFASSCSDWAEAADSVCGWGAFPFSCTFPTSFPCDPGSRGLFFGY